MIKQSSFNGHILKLDINPNSYLASGSIATIPQNHNHTGVALTAQQAQLVQQAANIQPVNPNNNAFEFSRSINTNSAETPNVQSLPISKTPHHTIYIPNEWSNIKEAIRRIAIIALHENPDLRNLPIHLSVLSAEDTIMLISQQKSYHVTLPSGGHTIQSGQPSNVALHPTHNIVVSWYEHEPDQPTRNLML